MEDIDKLIAGILKFDSRRVVAKDGKIIFKLLQEQEYTEEQRQAMLKAWNQKVKEYQNYLNSYDERVEAAKKEMEVQLQNMKNKIEKELEFLKEGIKLWSSPESDD